MMKDLPFIKTKIGIALSLCFMWLLIAGCQNGKKNGLMKQYWPNGKLMAETPYSNDTIDGTMKEYDKNGKLKSEIIYKRGVKVEEDSIEEVYDTTKLRNELFFTRHDIFKTGSILIEQYKKGSNFSVLIKREYDKIQNRSTAAGTEWEFNLGDPIDIQYDYRFFFNDGSDTIKYDLKDMKFHIVCVGSINHTPVGHANILGEWTLNGSHYSGGNITFK